MADKYLNKENVGYLKQKINDMVDNKLSEYSKTSVVQTMIDSSIDTAITSALEDDY